MYNGWGREASMSVISPGGSALPFTVHSFFITASFKDGMRVELKGFGVNGALKGSQMLTVSRSPLVAVDLKGNEGFKGLGRFTVSTSGGNFAEPNLCGTAGDETRREVVIDDMVVSFDA
jgi:hypothetical protein